MQGRGPKMYFGIQPDSGSWRRECHAVIGHFLRFGGGLCSFYRLPYRRFRKSTPPLEELREMAASPKNEKVGIPTAVLLFCSGRKCLSMRPVGARTVPGLHIVLGTWV